MSRIIANEDVLEYCQNAAPGNKTVYVNMDAINELPEQFEVVLVEVKFDTTDLKKSFTNVGTKKKPSWYPQTDLMYAIAKARGVKGGLETITEPIWEQVDISEMYLSDVPQVIKKKTGYIVRKKSSVIQEDGTELPSSSRHGVFNAWEEALKLWHKEEKATEGYDSRIIKEYPSGDKYYEYTYDGQVQKKAIKYDTKYKRKCHFDDLMDVSLGQADTKAHLKTIRELAGLMTGYATDDLKEGKFIFAKVRRSSAALKLEHAAHLDRIAHSGIPSPAALELFAPGEPEEITGIVEDAPETSTEKDVTEPVEKEKPKPKRKEPVKPTQVQEILGIFQVYEHLEGLSDEEKLIIAKCIKWLESKPDEKDAKYATLWTAVVSRLKEIEKKVDLQDMVEHKF